LVNLWATWCGPCREEMPTLDALQSELGGAGFEVVALSLDRQGASAVTQFYQEIGIEHLSVYVDDSGMAGNKLKAVGIPTTLLLNTEGQEIGRLVGTAEWDSAEMITFLADILS
ncbi:MAG: TlpA disulfide reductase family protein, partial [Natronospirillum sp.]